METLFTFIYLQCIYKIRKLILKKTTVHIMYISQLILLVHRHNIKATLFMKFALVKVKYLNI